MTSHIHPSVYLLLVPLVNIRIIFPPLPVVDSQSLIWSSADPAVSQTRHANRFKKLKSIICSGAGGVGSFLFWWKLQSSGIVSNFVSGGQFQAHAN